MPAAPGADTLTSSIVTEELALGDPDIAAVLARTSMLAHLLFDRLMTPEQRARFLPSFVADDRYHLALADLEPDRDAVLGIRYHRPEIERSRREDHRRAVGRCLGRQRRQGPDRQRATGQAVRGRGEQWLRAA
jgi:hypothetical protein